MNNFFCGRFGFTKTFSKDFGRFEYVRREVQIKIFMGAPEHFELPRRRAEANEGKNFEKEQNGDGDPSPEKFWT